MNSIIEQEMPVFEDCHAEIETANEQGRIGKEAAQEDVEMDYSYVQFMFEVPEIVNLPYQELTDEEVITLADKAGTFDFLKDPEEDIYSPSDGTPI